MELFVLVESSESEPLINIYALNRIDTVKAL